VPDSNLTIAFKGFATAWFGYAGAALIAQPNQAVANP